MTQSLPARIAMAMTFSISLMAVSYCVAAPLQVAVLDARNKPIAEIVITVVSDATTTARAVSPQVSSTAIMDQVNKEFVPEVLVVRTGTTVSFPNSDSVAHQVYSFSPVKRFSLPLYRGKPYPPVVFDQPGIATLGCNIHDHMVGYILVTDAPHFGQSNAQGQWSHEVPAGTYRVRAWHPRANEEMTDQVITVSESTTANVTFKFNKPFRPLHPPPDRRIRDY